MKLSEMKNIGSLLETILNRVDIMTADELRSLGTEETFKKIQHLVAIHAALMTIYAIECAIQNIPRKELRDERKEELSWFYKKLN